MQKQLTHSPNSEEKNSSGSRQLSGAAEGGDDDDDWKHPGPEYPGCKGGKRKQSLLATVLEPDPPLDDILPIIQYCLHILKTNDQEE